MRRHWAVGLGLLLALAAPAAAQQPKHNRGHGPTRLPAGHYCAKCAANLPKRVPADPNSLGMGPTTTVAAAPGGCVECATLGEAPGLAHVGNGAEAPGYAAVGVGTMPAAEPAPIGVMRAGYADAAGALPPAPSAAPAAPRPVPGSAPLSAPMSHPGTRRPSVVSHMLGLPRPGALSAARNARLRSQHAAIRYDDASSRVSDLPASMVYGR
jgi:hypothetical protein